MGSSLKNNDAHSLTKESRRQSDLQLRRLRRSGVRRVLEGQELLGTEGFVVDASGRLDEVLEVSATQIKRVRHGPSDLDLQAHRVRKFLR